MKIKDCKQGLLVQNKDGVFGMIVGITNNCHSADQRTREESERAIPLVQWQCGRTHSIHPTNLNKA